MGPIMNRKTKLNLRGIKNIKDPKIRNELKKMFFERQRLIKKRDQEIKKQEEIHNKYLPPYLAPKILNAVGFIEYTKRKGELDMPGMTNFLIKEKKFNQKEIGWILLLLSFETIGEIMSTPEVANLIRLTINKTKGTIH
jgi:hypothetical protein